MKSDEIRLRDLLAAIVAGGMASSDHFNPNAAISRRILAEQAHLIVDELLARSVQTDTRNGGGVE